MKSSKVQWVELRELIAQSDERNTDGRYTVDDVRGLSVQKKITETKANMEGVSVSSYKLLKPNQFAYVPDTSRRGDKMSLGFNETEETYLVSSISCVFEVRDSDVLHPVFLYLIFCRPEFDRYARFHSWGSAREAFAYEDMERVRIPLPSIEEQRTIVDAWKSLRNIKEQNEALAAPLMQLCQSYIEDCRKKYMPIPFADYVQKRDERNQDEKCTNVKGLTVYKEFIETKADMTDVSLKNYKRVYPGDIAYVSTTNRNGDRIACGLASEECIISSIYDVFYSKDENILDTSYLFMWFKRPEMDRYARYNSWGSARETITWEDLTAYRIPIPPIDVQRAVVSLYQCALEYKAIAAEADTQARSICSALMQHAINS